MNEGEAALSRRRFLQSMPGRLFDGLRTWFAGDAVPEPTAVVRVARLEINACLAWAGMNCQICYLACPRRERALWMEEAKPAISPEACDGCGLCESACRMVNDGGAIRMIPAVSAV